MNNFFKKYYIPVIIFLILLGLIAIIDKALAIGLILLAFLFGITFLILSKLETKGKTLYSLLLIVLIIHLGATLFIHYANFQPFSGGAGDHLSYHKTAVEISQRFRQGYFSLEGLKIYHYYPVIIGVLYLFTLPEMIIGQLFGVWLAILGVLLTYLIVIEIGPSPPNELGVRASGPKKWAFLIGLIVNIYPSYLFYTSLLLKDTLVIPLFLLGMLLCLKLIKDFSWRKFLVFYIVLISIVHFRFYIGYALLFSFIFCWLLLAKLNLRKKIIYAIIIIPLLGFLPEISANQGFYGIDSFKQYLNPKVINYYREVVYTPSVQTPSLVNRIFYRFGITSETSTSSFPTEFSSSWVREKVDFKKNPFNFLKDNIKSFIYVFLGPFLWQMKYPRHLFALLEIIPWYFLLFFIAKGIWRSIKTRNMLVLPLILFSFLVLVVMALFFNNFGIITRIRIPVFITLLCLIPLGFNKKT